MAPVSHGCHPTLDLELGAASGVTGACHGENSQLTGIYGDRLQRVTSVMTGPLVVPFRHVG